MNARPDMAATVSTPPASTQTAAPGAKAGMTDATFARLITSALTTGLIALVLMAGAATWLVGKTREYAGWVNHTYAAEAKIYHLQSLIERAETARRGFLIAPDETYWATYLDAAAKAPDTVEDLATFTTDNPVQRRHMAELKPLLDVKLLTWSQTMIMARTGAGDRALEMFRAGRGQRTMQKIRAVTEAMLAEEARLLTSRTGDEQRYSSGLLAVVLVAAALLLALTVGTFVLIRRYAGDLHRSERALRRLNEGLEAAVALRTADLTRANEEIQRFAYIVSHDLRSPLVNVLGFTSELEVSLGELKTLRDRAEAEAPALLTRAAREAIDRDVPEAIGFIRSSTQKMDRLINAILKLSREGRRNLNPEPVAVGPMVQGIVDSLRQQIAERGATVEADGPLPDLVTDRLALEQVLSNLVENALKYTAPGRPAHVAVRGRVEGLRTILEVQDNGRGIDAKDHERVFELFRRAGAQDQAGEGIGLAHVRATVHRMGGRIDCVSALDQGATFRLFLPSVLSREGAPV